jgi:tRNA C32,U32 (ribose-2'-O)-methylase TrmJ
VPLCTGPLAVTNFGVVVAFRPPFARVFAVGAPAVLEVAELLEVVDELLDDPHPANATSAAQTENVARRLLICARTLA